MFQIQIIDSIEMTVKIFCDNVAALFFAKNNKRSLASKTIDVKYFVVRESIKEDDEIEVIKVGTLEQLVEPLTKLLSVAAYQGHVKKMRV